MEELHSIEIGRLLTVEEAALALRVRESTIRAWILRRKIDFVKVGRRVRVPATAVDKLIRAGLVTSEVTRGA